MGDNIKSQRDHKSIERKIFLEAETIIRMAKRLRLDLGKFGGFIGANSQGQELWKNPLLSFIVISYEKRFGRYK